MKFGKALFNVLNESIVDRYGLGLVIRRYGYYPSWLPITVTGEHGPNLDEVPAGETVKRISPFYFAYAKRKSQWKIGKTIIRHPSPFVWYRRKNKINLSANPEGSIFFYTHSTKLVKSYIDEETFFENLRSIPQEFLPITICLHFNSLEERFTKKIEEQGYKWITLGKGYDHNLIKNFYEVVPKFKYAMGNNFTSGMLYCTEMGMPCSVVFTDGIKYVNNGNKKYKEVNWDLKDHPIKRWRTAMELFFGFNTAITNEQLQFIEDELGLDLIDSQSNRLKVMFCLYASLPLCFFKMSGRLMAEALSNIPGLNMLKRKPVVSRK